MPLHIFEPRYKLMIGRCLKEHLEFGMILAAESGAPTIATANGMAKIGCTAQVVQKIKEYPDGRMDILAEGRTPFALMQLLDEQPYYEGVVVYQPDDRLPQNPEQETLLMEVFQKCHQVLYGEAWIAARDAESVPLAYRMAARLPFDLSAKQVLLETRSERQRRQTLIAFINELLPKLANNERVRRRAGGNGHSLN